MGSEGWMWGLHPWVMSLAVIATLLVWAAVVIAIVRTLGSRGSPPSVDAESLRGLDERLAAGDIGVEEYLWRRRRIVDGH